MRASGRIVEQADQEIVSGIYVEAKGEATVTLNRITLRCGGLSGAGTGQFNDEDFWSDPLYRDNTFEAPRSEYRRGSGKSVCPDGDNRGTLAVGIHGRAGKWLDALGLICEDVKLPPPPVRPAGRVTLAPGTTPTPPQAICDRARRARARNSPAAPGLEESCRSAAAAGEIAPVKPAARVKVDPTVPAGPSRVCELARVARARNSPAAPGLEDQCRKVNAAAAAASAAGEESAGRAPNSAGARPPAA